MKTKLLFCLLATNCSAILSVQATMIGGWYEDGLQQLFPSDSESNVPNSRPDRAIGHQQNPYKYSGWAGSPNTDSDSSVTYDLSWPETKGPLELKLSRMRAIWAMGEATPFKIEVQVKEDGPWTLAFEGKTDAEGDNLETYNFPAIPATRARINIPAGASFRMRYVQFYGEVIDHATPFVHPGITITAKDLKRVKELIAAGTQPNARGFEALSSDSRSEKEVTPKPSQEIVWTAIQTEKIQTVFSSDGIAAYQQGLMWALTEDPVYARNVMKLMRAWVDTLESSSGDASLSSFGSTINFAQGVELVKHSSFNEWDSELEERFLEMIDEHVTPYIEAKSFTKSNWTSQRIKALLSLAIWRNDRYQFDRAIALTKASIETFDENGYAEEVANRDWNHGMMHHGGIVECAEVAWNQGVDVYSYKDNHIALGFENVAWADLVGGESNGTYPDPGAPIKWMNKKVMQPGPTLNAFGWEVAYNHYVTRMGLKLPKLEERIMAAREADGGDEYLHHYGWATVLKANVGKK